MFNKERQIKENNKPETTNQNHKFNQTTKLKYIINRVLSPNLEKDELLMNQKRITVGVTILSQLKNKYC